MPELGERSSLVKTRCAWEHWFRSGSTGRGTCRIFFSQGPEQVVCCADGARMLRSARKSALRRAKKGSRKKDARKGPNGRRQRAEFEAEIMGECNPDTLCRWLRSTGTA